MGLLEDLSKQGGGIAAMLAKNPQLLAAVVRLLSTRDTSIGDAGGLGSVVSAFQKKGLGDVVSSWISTGQNQAISGQQITEVLGSDIMSQIAKQAGMTSSEAGPALASLLPAMIDQLTPKGQIPATNDLEGMLGGLLGGLGGR